MDRPRVVEALRRAMSRPVTFVAAPIGYGKSRAVAAALDGAAVLRVGEAASLADVALAFATALAADRAGIPLAFAACARRAYAADPAPRFAAFVAEAARTRGGTIAVDDLQEILGLAGVPAFLDALVARTGGGAGWVFVARDLAPMAVAGWLAKGLAGVPIDETVLSLRSDEMRRYAAERGVDRSALAGVESRPAAIALACDLLLSGTAIRPLAAHGRSLRALVGLAFATADEAERHILALGAHLGPLDDGLLTALPGAAGAAALAALRARLPSAFDGATPASWFRSAVRERIAAEPRYAGLVAEALGTLERAGRPLDALRLALRADALEAVGTIVARHGERFFEAGTQPAVVAALARLELPEEAAPVLAMRAILEAQHGRHDTADAHFEAALARAEGPLRTTIVHRYALELLRRGRSDAAALLEAHLAGAADDPPALAPLYATLATAYALAERHDDARRAIARALATAPAGFDPAARARMEHQRAFVALRRGDAEEADEAAYRAIASAQAAGAYDVAARAHTVLYELAYDADEPFSTLAALEGVAHYAALAGETSLRTFALLGAYDLEAARGDEDGMRRIETALADFDVSESPEGTLRALLPGRALALAWRGDFAQAYRLVAGTAPGETNAGLRAIRQAEIARYAAAAGLAIEAREAIAAAENDLHQVSESARRDRVQASLALAFVLLGDDAAALRALPAALSGLSARRTAVLLDAVALYRLRGLGEVGAPALLDALELARERGFGGFARFVEALPRRPAVVPADEPDLAPGPLP